MIVNNDEIRTTREVARELLSILGLLEHSDVEKIVVMQGSKIRGVILSPGAYEALSAGEEDE